MSHVLHRHYVTTYYIILCSQYLHTAAVPIGTYDYGMLFCGGGYPMASLNQILADCVFPFINYNLKMKYLIIWYLICLSSGPSLCDAD